MDVKVCKFKKMDVKFKFLSLYYLAEIDIQILLLRRLISPVPDVRKRGYASVSLPLYSSCSELQGSAWKRLQSPMGGTTTEQSYATVGAGSAWLRNCRDTAPVGLSLPSQTLGHQCCGVPSLDIRTHSQWELRGQPYPLSRCNKGDPSTPPRGGYSQRESSRSGWRVVSYGNPELRKAPWGVGHSHQGSGGFLEVTRAWLMRHSQLESSQVVGDWTSRQGLSSTSSMRSDAGKHKKISNSATNKSSSSTQGYSKYPCIHSKLFAVNSHIIYYLPALGTRLMTARQRLHCLLLCYQLCKHTSKGRALYNQLITHFGKEFSCCTMGDGPPRRKLFLAGGTEIYAGCNVFVPWSSFPEAQRAEWSNFQDHMVLGTYQRQINNAWQISFPVLNIHCTRGIQWIREYGSTLHTVQAVLTRDVYINRSCLENDHVEPVKKKVKRSVRSIFTPVKDMRVYVPWHTFPESSQHTIAHENLWTTGIYAAENSKGWWVSFPVLGDRRFHMDWDWIDAWGSTITRTEDMYIVRRSDIMPPKPIRSYLEALRPELSSDSDDQVPTITEHTIEIPELQIDGKWAVCPNLTSTNLGIAVLNINKLQEPDITVGREFWRQGCGITFLIDTRVAKPNEKYLIQQWRQIGGNESLIHFSPQNPHAGGQAVLLDPYWARRVISTWSDPSNLAVVYELKLSTKEGIVRIISVYWPVPHQPETNSLGAQVERWLELENKRLTVDEYVLQIIRSRLRKRAYRHVLIGDFNRRKDGMDKLEIGLTDAHEGGSFSTFYKGLRPISKIDYILHSRTCLSAGYADGPEWQRFSDHRPIWAIFPSAGPRARIRKSATITIRRDFSRKAESEDFQAAMFADQFNNESPSQRILDICTKAKYHAHRKVLRKRLNLWSPSSAAIIIRQEMVADLRSYARHSQVQLEEIQSIIKRAQDRTHRIGKDGPQLWNEPEKSLFTIEQLTHICLQQTDGPLKDELISLNKLMQGRKRKLRLELIHERVNRIKKDKYRFFKTLGTPRLRLDLSHLEVNGSNLTDPEQIDTALSNHFSAMFQANGMPRGLWDKLDEQTLQTSNPSIPSKLVSIIWKSIRSVPEDKRLRVGLALSPEKVTPTLTEFLTILQASSSESAGGPSGATYHMLKHLPMETLELLYNSILECWLNKDPPKWWKTKLMYLLAKRPNDHTIGNIRPIVLLEITRKLWFKIIGRKISAAIEAENILQPNQYGFRKSRSTSDNIIQLINTMEATAGSPLYATSWDIVGAFNAPPRPWLELGLRRVGVPEELARTIAYLDDLEVNHLLTPHYLQTGKGTPFTASQGCGQGDVTSPLLWNLYFDIVLTALNTVPSGIHFADDHFNAHQTMDTAFADDLLSFSATLMGIQAKADIMSAAAGILGFQLALNKFRTFSMGATGQVTLYGHDWSPVVITCSTDGFVRYLGSRFNIDGTYDEEERLMISSLSDILSRIKHKVHRSSHGRDYINRAIIPKIQYTGGLGIIRPRIQEKASSLLGQEYRKHSHVMASFPSAILNAPVDMGGLGFTDPIDALATAKWNLIQRVLSGPVSATRTALTSILLRHSAHNNHQLEPSMHRITDANGTWLEDVVNMLSFSDTILTGYHALETNDLDLPLNATEEMLEMGIARLSDVIDFAHGGRTISPAHFGLPASSWSSQSTTTKEILFAPDQIWASEPDPSVINIIVGWAPSGLLTQQWQLNTAKRRGAPRRFGKGQYTIIDPATLTVKCVAPIWGSFRTLKFSTPVTGRRRNLLNKDADCHRTPPGIITASDATYSMHSGIFPTFHPTNNVGAIVQLAGTYPYDQRSAISFHLPPTTGRAFMSELVTMAGALSMYTGVVNSDCQGAIQSLVNSKSRLSLRADSARLRWTPSHPERRALSGAWSAEDHAIAYADSVAGGSAPSTLISFSQLTTNILQRSGAWAPISPTGMLLEHPTRQKQKIQLVDYLQQRTKHNRAVWSQTGLQFTTQLARTVPQRAALANLYLSRFNPDIQYTNHQRPKCTCSTTCRNILDDWLSTCQRDDVRKCRETHKQTLERLDIPTVMWQNLMQQLQQQDNVLLYRGHWSQSARSQLELIPRQHTLQDTKRWRNATALITRTLTSHALDLHHLISSTDNIKHMHSTPTTQPGVASTQAPIKPIFVDNYAQPLHTAVLELPLTHTPLAIVKPVKEPSTVTDSKTPLRLHLYPPIQSTKKKKFNRVQPESTSAASTTPSTTTIPSYTKAKSHPTTTSSTSSALAGSPAYKRPVKRPRSPTRETNTSSIIHHFPRIGPEPVRQRPQTITTTTPYRQSTIKSYLERSEVSNQHPVQKKIKMRHSASTEMWPSAPSAQRETQCLGSTDEETTAPITPYRQPPIKSYLERSEISNHHPLQKKIKNEESLAECSCSCHDSSDTRQIICDHSSNISNSVSNCSSYVRNVSSSNSTQITSMSFSPSFHISSSSSSSSSSCNGSLNSSAALSDLGQELRPVCSLCLCLRGRFRPP